MKRSFLVGLTFAALSQAPSSGAEPPVIGGLHHAGADKFAGAVLAVAAVLLWQSEVRATKKRLVA